MGEHMYTVYSRHTCGFHEAFVCLGVNVVSTVKMQLH